MWYLVYDVLDYDYESADAEEFRDKARERADVYGVGGIPCPWASGVMGVVRGGPLFSG